MSVGVIIGSYWPPREVETRNRPQRWHTLRLAVLSVLGALRPGDEIHVSLAGDVGGDEGFRDYKAHLEALGPDVHVAYRGDHASQHQHLAKTVPETTSDWIATMDDDDLVSAQWITAATELLKCQLRSRWRGSRPLVVRTTITTHLSCGCMHPHVCAGIGDHDGINPKLIAYGERTDYGGTFIPRAVLLDVLRDPAVVEASRDHPRISDVAVSLGIDECCEVTETLPAYYLATSAIAGLVPPAPGPY